MFVKIKELIEFIFYKGLCLIQSLLMCSFKIQELQRNEFSLCLVSLLWRMVSMLGYATCNLEEIFCQVGLEKAKNLLSQLRIRLTLTLESSRRSRLIGIRDLCGPRCRSTSTSKRWIRISLRIFFDHILVKQIGCDLYRSLEWDD